MVTCSKFVLASVLWLLCITAVQMLLAVQAIAAMKCSTLNIIISSKSAAVGSTITFTKAPSIGVAEVHFDGANAVAGLTPLKISGDEQITVTVPPMNGKLETIVDLYDGGGKLVCTEKLGLLPMIMGISSTTAKVGDSVVITGSYFDMYNIDNNKVTINGVEVDRPVTIVPPNGLRVLVPKTFSGPVQLETQAGKSNANVALSISTPIITDVSPRQGLIGEPIEISGANFDNSCVVKINNMVVTPVDVKQNKLRVVVPLTTTGPVKVIKGAEEATYQGEFKVVTQMVIKSTDENKLSSGMKRKLMAHTAGFYPKDGKQTPYFAPAGSELRIVSDEDKDGNIIVLITCVGKLGKAVKIPFEYEVVSNNTAYVISANKLRSEYPSKGYGFTSGILTVPYKYYPTKQELSGQPTVSGYVGWQFGDTLYLGYELSVIGSAGLGVVPITTTDSSGTKSTGSGASFAAAWGFVMTVNKNFQVGIVQGWDWTNKSSNYEFQGKPWIAVSLGTAIF